MIQEYTLSLWRCSLATGANMQVTDQITEIKKYNLKMSRTNTCQNIRKIFIKEGGMVCI